MLRAYAPRKEWSFEYSFPTANGTTTTYSHEKRVIKAI
jgi:hypothetical protein